MSRAAGEVTRISTEPLRATIVLTAKSPLPRELGKGLVEKAWDVLGDLATVLEAGAPSGKPALVFIRLEPHEDIAVARCRLVVADGYDRVDGLGRLTNGDTEGPSSPNLRVPARNVLRWRCYPARWLGRSPHLWEFL